PKNQNPSPATLVQGSNQRPACPRHQRDGLNDTVEVQKREHRSGELIHERSAESRQGCDSQTPLKKIKSQPAKNRVHDKVKLERVVKRQKKMKQVRRVKGHVVRV